MWSYWWRKGPSVLVAYIPYCGSSCSSIPWSTGLNIKFCRRPFRHFKSLFSYLFHTCKTRRVHNAFILSVVSTIYDGLAFIICIYISIQHLIQLNRIFFVWTSSIFTGGISFLSPIREIVLECCFFCIYIKCTFGISFLPVGNTHTHSLPMSLTSWVIAKGHQWGTVTTSYMLVFAFFIIILISCTIFYKKTQFDDASWTPCAINRP